VIRLAVFGNAHKPLIAGGFSSAAAAREQPELSSQFINQIVSFEKRFGVASAGRIGVRSGITAMSRFGFLARKAGLAEKPNEPVAARNNPLELDEELFSSLGAQFGGENEALRNLLLDANSKINELDTIKSAVGKLVDPVSTALRDFEAEKTEKVGLQTVLNNTRTA
jgi:hypothetical protein